MFSFYCTIFLLGVASGALVTLLYYIPRGKVGALEAMSRALRSELKEQEEETDAKLRLLNTKHRRGSNPF